jgi:diguanylate cyclase (GGDEF)-like protein
MAQSKLRAMERERELSREVEEMLKAEHDSHGLYNRTAMETTINRFFANYEKADSTFFMLDLDYFKTVNDTFGHDAGDELLVRVANVLLSCFRDEDS